MKNNIPGPNFAKNSFRRSTSFNHNGPINQEIIASEPEDPTGKNKLKYVQMEIAEREACSLLRTLCQEASQHLRSTHNEADFENNDMLTGAAIF